MPMPALRNRPRLLRIFRLSCLCLTESNQSARNPVSGRRVSSADTLSSVLLPAHSYLSSVPRSVTSYVSESALAKFHELSHALIQGMFLGTLGLMLTRLDTGNFTRHF